MQTHQTQDLSTLQAIADQALAMIRAKGRYNTEQATIKLAALLGIDLKAYEPAPVSDGWRDAATVTPPKLEEVICKLESGLTRVGRWNPNQGGYFQFAEFLHPERNGRNKYPPIEQDANKVLQWHPISLYAAPAQPAEVLVQPSAIDERALFEEKLRSHIDPTTADDLIALNESGNYDLWAIMLAWELWKDRAALAPQHLAPAVEISPEELAAFRKFDEQVSDGEGYTVSKQMMRRLASIGLVNHKSAGYYAHTYFGLSVLEVGEVATRTQQAREDARDAARYRWLRDTQNADVRDTKHGHISRIGTVDSIFVCDQEWSMTAPHPNELDALIDKAMAKHTEDEGAA